jgi:hypothetical protein
MPRSIAAALGEHPVKRKCDEPAEAVTRKNRSLDAQCVTDSGDVTCQLFHEIRSGRRTRAAHSAQVETHDTSRSGKTRGLRVPRFFRQTELVKQHDRWACTLVNHVEFNAIEPNSHPRDRSGLNSPSPRYIRKSIAKTNPRGV